jgi:hypothetical protein
MCLTGICKYEYPPTGHCHLPFGMPLPLDSLCITAEPEIEEWTNLGKEIVEDEIA